MGEFFKKLNLKNIEIDVETHAPLSCSGIKILKIDAVNDRYVLEGNNYGKITLHDLHKLSYTKYNDKFEYLAEKRINTCSDFKLQCLEWYPNDAGIFFSAISSYKQSHVTVYDTSKFQKVFEFEIDRYVKSISVGTRNVVAVASQQKNIILCDLNTQNSSIVLQGHKSDLNTVKFLDTNLLISTSNDGTIRTWDARQSGFKALLNTTSCMINDIVTPVEILPCTYGLLVKTKGNHLGLMNLKQYSELKDQSTESTLATKLQPLDFSNPIGCFSTKSSTLLYHSLNSTEEEMHKNSSIIKVLDLKSNKLIQSIESPHFKSISTLNFRHKSNNFLSGGNDGFIFSYLGKL